MFHNFLSTYIKNLFSSSQDFSRKSVGFVLIKGIVYRKEFQYLRDRKVVLDKNPKTPKSHRNKKKKNPPKKLPEWFSITTIVKYWSYSFHEDVVINQQTLI